MPLSLEGKLKKTDERVIEVLHESKRRGRLMGSKTELADIELNNSRVRRKAKVTRWLKVGGVIPSAS